MLFLWHILCICSLCLKSRLFWNGVTKGKLPEVVLWTVCPCFSSMQCEHEHYTLQCPSRLWRTSIGNFCCTGRLVRGEGNTWSLNRTVTAVADQVLARLHTIFLPMFHPASLPWGVSIDLSYSRPIQQYRRLASLALRTHCFSIIFIPCPWIGSSKAWLEVIKI